MTPLSLKTDALGFHEKTLGIVHPCGFLSLNVFHFSFYRKNLHIHQNSFSEQQMLSATS